VTVVTLEQIQNESPTNNIADLVNQQPALAGSTKPANSRLNLSSGQAGINALNLRNLGEIRTLVLLDGRRSVGSTVTGLVDVNTIPQMLIKSVEISRAVLRRPMARMPWPAWSTSSSTRNMRAEGLGRSRHHHLWRWRHLFVQRGGGQILRRRARPYPAQRRSRAPRRHLQCRSRLERDRLCPHPGSGLDGHQHHPAIPDPPPGRRGQFHSRRPHHGLGRRHREPAARHSISARTARCCNINMAR
jgi:hypothetical protein